MTEPFEEFQTDIDAALADPVRRARVEEYGRQIDLILAHGRKFLVDTQPGLGKNPDHVSKVRG